MVFINTAGLSVSIGSVIVLNPHILKSYLSLQNNPLFAPTFGLTCHFNPEHKIYVYLQSQISFMCLYPQNQELLPYGCCPQFFQAQVVLLSFCLPIGPSWCHPNKIYKHLKGVSQDFKAGGLLMLTSGLPIQSIAAFMGIGDTSGGSTICSIFVLLFEGKAIVNKDRGN